MRVKRYVVDSMPDALQRIRNELGKDAVILNTKEVRSGGFLGWFGKKKIEVIAATDSNASTAPAVPPTPAVPSAAAHFLNAVSAAENRQAVSEPVLEEHPAPSGKQPAKPKSKEDILLEEIKHMKEMVYRLSRQNDEASTYPPAFKELERRLLSQGVDVTLVDELLRNALEQAGDAETATGEQARQLIKEQLRKLLHTGKPKGIAPDTRIAHFVGPTGVGKTTTIAKLAAEQVLKHNRKVGFITSDTYRIAAVEQLRTYATILNVPMEVVFSPQELNRAFRQLHDRDIIFMDTAGRNYRNEMYVSELNSLLKSQQNSETFLVLSLTTKYDDMKAITANFCKFKLDKVLFTKMDETDSLGAIANLVHDFSLQLSYITTGQNVPDDIAEANEELIIDRLLEEHAHV